MEIITYNIWDLPLWFVRNREKRLLEIGRFLVDRGTEIVCLQESWSLEYRESLSSYMRDSGYYDAITMANIRRKNGGLLTFSKYPIKSVRFIAFGRRGVSVSEIIGNKGVLETIIETPQGLLRVLNIHLHHQSSSLISTTGVRLRQIRKLFSALADDPIATVLAGDFNEHDMPHDYAFFEHFKQQGFSHHHPEHTLLPTYRVENHLVNNWLNRVKISQRYDYILTKNIDTIGLSIKSNTPIYLDVPLSDHDPVSLQLETIATQVAE